MSIAHPHPSGPVGGPARPDPALLQLLAEQMPCAVWATDSNLVFTTSHGAGLAAIGLRPGEVDGAHLSDYFPADHPTTDAHRRALAGEPVRYDAEYRGRWFDCRVEPLRGPDGAVAGCVGVALDVTARKRAEEELRRTADLLRAVAETTTDAVFVKDREGKYLFFNDAAARFVGRPAVEVLGTDDAALFEPASARRVMARDRRVMESGLTETAEEELTAAGVTRVYHATKGPFRDATGAVVGLIGVSRDVTDRVRTERALRESEERYRAIVEATPECVKLVAPDGTLLQMNPAGLRMVEADGPGAVLGGCVYDLVVPAHRAAVRAFNERVCRGEGGALAFDMVGLRGARRHMETTAVPLPAPGGGYAQLAVTRDVTDRKRAEGALRASEERYRGVFESDLIGVLTWGADGAVTAANDEYLRIVGYTRAEFEAGTIPWSGLTPPEYRHLDAAAAVRAGGRCPPFEKEYVRKDGTRVPVLVGGAPLGGAGEGVAFVLDLTDRRRAEQELRLRDRAIQAVSQGILITDPNQQDNPVIYASPGFERLTGYPAAEVVGRNCRFLRGPDTDPAAVARVRAAVEAGEPCTVELLNYRKDGTPFWNELSISPVRDDTGRVTHFVWVQADVTARRQLEEQYRQAQKMEAVGRLAGGVAHDFNNLLTVINGFADLLAGMLEGNDDAWPLAEEIGKAGKRAAGLTRQLLAFSRKQVLQPKVINPNALLADLGTMLRRLLGEDVELVLDLDPAGRRVRVDPGQLEQVVMNLVVNARDAMPTGGRLTIQTRNAELDPAYAEARAEVRPGSYVRLAVTDTGCGMDPRTLARVFEPFFTTKGPGKGTGLGLPTVYGIVTQSGGHVELHSEVGAGTTVEVYLPAAAPDAGPGSRPGAPGGAPGGRETVLLVEDEEAVRALARRLLRTRGYEVLEAPNGADALEIAARHAGAIDLLVTDVVMPRMDGRELAARLGELRPGVKVLYVSGYTDDAVVRYGVREAQVAFLQKPFAPDALARKVREILDGRA